MIFYWEYGIMNWFMPILIIYYIKVKLFHMIILSGINLKVVD